MNTKTRTQQALALLLPAGTLGASFALAAVQAQAAIAPAAAGNHDAPSTSAPPSVADRLDSIRREMTRQGTGAEIELDADGLLLAQWVNVGGGGGGLGWRNGGWGNGGWHNWGNGGWHNGPWGNGGWHNWGNGGWHNWGNGWHNGPWNNYWHNW